MCPLDPRLHARCVREASFVLCSILRDAGSPLWMGARSQSHTAWACFCCRRMHRPGLCMVKEQHGCRLCAQRGSHAFWTFSVNRADGHFAFCLFDFSQSVGGCYMKKKPTEKCHVSDAENVNRLATRAFVSISFLKFAAAPPTERN